MNVSQNAMISAKVQTVRCNHLAPKQSVHCRSLQNYTARGSCQNRPVLAEIRYAHFCPEDPGSNPGRAKINFYK